MMCSLNVYMYACMPCNTIGYLIFFSYCVIKEGHLSVKAQIPLNRAIAETQDIFLGFECIKTNLIARHILFAKYTRLKDSALYMHKYGVTFSNRSSDPSCSLVKASS